MELLARTVGTLLVCKKIKNHLKTWYFWKTCFFTEKYDPVVTQWSCHGPFLWPSGLVTALLYDPETLSPPSSSWWRTFRSIKMTHGGEYWPKNDPITQGGEHFVPKKWPRRIHIFTLPSSGQRTPHGASFTEKRTCHQKNVTILWQDCPWQAS